MSEFRCCNTMTFIPRSEGTVGSTNILNELLDNIKDVGSDAYAVLSKILQFANNKDHKINIKGLSTQLHMSKDRVSKAMHKLINFGYIKRTPIKHEKYKNLIVGYHYDVFEERQVVDVEETNKTNVKKQKSEIVENTVSHRNPDIGDTENQDGKQQNIKQKNNVVVVSEKEKQLFDLYKSFKLEKLMLPHTRKLLKKYMDKFDLDVFEQVFISASSDSVKKKYAYIKKVLEALDLKGIRTLEDYNKDQEEYKASKEKKYSKASNKANNGNKNKVETRFHNINTHCDKYTTDELESMVKGSQSARGVSKKDPIHDMYIRACENGTDSLSSQSMVQIVIDYALKNNLDKPPKTVLATV